MSIMIDTVDFSTWLQAEMDEREWTQAELSRRAGIDRQLISMYITRKVTTPDKKSLSLIAGAFKLPVEQVYRAAHILPPPPNLNEEAEQIMHEVSKLPKQDQEDVLAYIRMRNNLRKKK